MAQQPFSPAFFNPFMLWMGVAMKTTEMLVSSGQVIGTRVNRMAHAGVRPSARDRKEFTLMHTEKVKAATESALAVATRMQSANYQLMARAWQQGLASLGAMSLLAGSRSFGEVLSRQNRLFNSLARSGRTHSRLSSDTARLASAALAPVHSAATANARRLARVKSRR
jgi:hypothetical protein